MLKKSLLTIGATLLIAAVLFLIYGLVEKVLYKKLVAEKRQTLAAPPLFKMDSTSYQVVSTKPVLLIYFNSECEHCQYELAELKKNLPAFSEATILLMSSENISAIRKAAQNIGLEGSPSLEFIKINQSDLYENFGSLSTPHIFIYGKDRKLIKEFKGETKMDAILQYLPK